MLAIVRIQQRDRVAIGDRHDVSCEHDRYDDRTLVFGARARQYFWAAEKRRSDEQKSRQDDSAGEASRQGVRGEQGKAHKKVR